MNQTNKILIVDDILENLKMLSDLLEPEGYHILIAPAAKWR
jgi:CheY-like chemotaxis protein